MNTAPILIFCFNRPIHTAQTIDALSKNYLAESSDVYFFLDGAKSDKDQKNIDAVYEVINRKYNFRSTTIIRSEKNKGLANSIIDGVTNTIEKYGKVIVLEDDIVTNKFFLTYMNKALNLYKNEQNIWHISGWNYPISYKDLEDSFFHQIMNCWGWATWSDRWQFFEKNPMKIIKNWTQEDIIKFNLNGAYNFWSQIELNQKGIINTWAIFWYATIFQSNGLCLNPTQSLVNNIGLDGSGENCIKNQFIKNNTSNKITRQIDFPKQIIKNQIAEDRIREYLISLKPSLVKRLIRKCVSIIKK